MKGCRARGSPGLLAGSHPGPGGIARHPRSRGSPNGTPSMPPTTPRLRPAVHISTPAATARPGSPVCSEPPMASSSPAGPCRSRTGTRIGRPAQRVPVSGAWEPGMATRTLRGPDAAAGPHRRPPSNTTRRGDEMVPVPEERHRIETPTERVPGPAAAQDAAAELQGRIHASPAGGPGSRSPGEGTRPTRNDETVPAPEERDRMGNLTERVPGPVSGVWEPGMATRSLQGRTRGDPGDRSRQPLPHRRHPSDTTRREDETLPAPEERHRIGHPLPYQGYPPRHRGRLAADGGSRRSPRTAELRTGAFFIRRPDRLDCPPPLHHRPHGPTSPG